MIRKALYKQFQSFDEKINNFKSLDEYICNQSFSFRCIFQKYKMHLFTRGKNYYRLWSLYLPSDLNSHITFNFWAGVWWAFLEPKLGWHVCPNTVLLYVNSSMQVRLILHSVYINGSREKQIAKIHKSYASSSCHINMYKSFNIYIWHVIYFCFAMNFQNNLSFFLKKKNLISSKL